jgi:hypothetical protein
VINGKCAVPQGLPPRTGLLCPYQSTNVPPGKTGSVTGDALANFFTNSNGPAESNVLAWTIPSGCVSVAQMQGQ